MVLKILTFPDPRLKIKANPVEEVDKALRCLLEEMVETMQAFKGIGLAGPQVNVPLRVIVIGSLQAEEAMPLKLINPEIVWTSEEKSLLREGCLSVPGRFADVSRSQKIRCQFIDETGSLREQEAQGLLSHIIQHELDHLSGVLFIDRLSPLKRQKVMKKKRERWMVLNFSNSVSASLDASPCRSTLYHLLNIGLRLSASLSRV